MHSGFRRKASKRSKHQKVKVAPFGIATIQISRSIRKNFSTGKLPKRAAQAFDKMTNYFITIKFKEMKKLIKLVPMMALLLGLGVYTVNAKMKALEAERAQQDPEWILTPGGDPSNPADYQLAPPGTANDCNNLEETVCVTRAPASSSNPSMPQFSPELQDALETDLDHPSIFKGPYTP